MIKEEILKEIAYYGNIPGSGCPDGCCHDNGWMLDVEKLAAFLAKHLPAIEKN
jgi:hypothetical protein